MMRVEVAYAASPERQFLLAVALAQGATVRDAIEASGVLAQCPEIDLERGRAGVFGKVRALDWPLHDGDRVEIYRPLAADPKERRRKRAAVKG